MCPHTPGFLKLGSAETPSDGLYYFVEQLLVFTG
ncbi:MAG: hypothetical protein JWN14_3280, partial [Chthonomonadales bacterium]|nr:hypothetical protein [Chthonomonadales bacterium]